MLVEAAPKRLEAHFAPVALEMNKSGLCQPHLHQGLGHCRLDEALQVGVLRLSVKAGAQAGHDFGIDAAAGLSARRQ